VMQLEIGGRACRLVHCSDDVRAASSHPTHL